MSNEPPTADHPSAARGHAGPAVPQAEGARPETPAEVIGRPHLLGLGRPLPTAFESGRRPSMVSWGLPGRPQEDAHSPHG